MSKRGYLMIAWLLAIAGTIGSLYSSEVLGFLPCDLCWYQRIFMYPLTIILAVGLLKEDKHVAHYALPFAILGTGVALFQYLLQKTTWLTGIYECTRGIPCTEGYINWFGFITLPFLSFVCFLLITICLGLARK